MFYEVLLVIITLLLILYFNYSQKSRTQVTINEDQVEVRHVEISEVEVDTTLAKSASGEDKATPREMTTEGNLTTRADFVNTEMNELPTITEEEEEVEANLEDLINEFIDYVRAKKVIKLDELSYKMKSDKGEVVNRLRELEDHGHTFGFVDRTGRYINLNEKELELLEKLVIKGKKKKYKKSELVEEFSKITGAPIKS